MPRYYYLGYITRPSSRLPRRGGQAAPSPANPIRGRPTPKTPPLFCTVRTRLYRCTSMTAPVHSCQSIVFVGGLRGAISIIHTPLQRTATARGDVASETSGRRNYMQIYGHRRYASMVRHYYRHHRRHDSANPTNTPIVNWPRISLDIIAQLVGGS